MKYNKIVWIGLALVVVVVLGAASCQRSAPSPDPIDNDAKNFNSEVALEYQLFKFDLQPEIVNTSTTDKIQIVASVDELKQLTYETLPNNLFENGFILSIIGKPQSSGGNRMKIKSITYMGADIDIDYSNDPPEPGQMQITFPTRPSLFIRLEKSSLPIGTPLNFNFYNSTTKTNQTITYMIEI